MLAACYLHNRTYHSGADGIPVTLLTGQTPDLSHLKVFGSPAYVHIPASQRRKMDDTAFAGVMVGYSTDTYGYLVYNPTTRRVVTTRHVRFDETFNGRLSEEGTHHQSTHPPAEVVDHQPTVDYSSSSSDDEDVITTMRITRSMAAPATPPTAAAIPVAVQPAIPTPIPPQLPPTPAKSH